MKHLKNFNESLQPVEVDELKDFCETYLAYLLDEGFVVDIKSAYRDLYGNVITTSSLPAGAKLNMSIDSTYIGMAYTICLSIPKDAYSNEKFNWSDIKDSFIPFLQLLSRRYKLVGRVNQVLVSSTDGENYYSYDYLTKDGYKGFRHVIEDYEINSIKIQVFEYL